MVQGQIALQEVFERFHGSTVTPTEGLHINVCGCDQDETCSVRGGGWIWPKYCVSCHGKSGWCVI